MGDIFISYASEDRATAEQLGRAFQHLGWGVWWDRKIPPGKTFDQVISQALNAAKCVVVLWSESSIHSDWVKEEASEGQRRGILVPVLIDEVSIPLGFRRIQAARLPGGRFADGDPEFEELKLSVAALLGQPRSHAPADSSRRSHADRTPPGRPRFEEFRIARRSAITLSVRRWLIWGPIIGAIAGFVASVTDRGMRVFVPEEFATMVGGGAAWGLLGGAVAGLLFGLLIKRYKSEE